MVCADVVLSYEDMGGPQALLLCAAGQTWNANLFMKYLRAFKTVFLTYFDLTLLP